MTRRRMVRPSLALVCDACDRSIYVRLDPTASETICPGCGRRHALHAGDGAHAAGDGPIRACLRCGLDRLYVQKDFNRTLGLAVFVVAAILSVPTWGISLLVATLVDLGLYYMLGDVTICYGCGAQHRGLAVNPEHGPFDLHVAEQVDHMPRPV